MKASFPIQFLVPAIVFAVAPLAAEPGAPGSGASKAPARSGTPARPSAAASASAPAPQVAYGAEILVLHATNEKKGIDPRIGAMAELRKPPFSAYDSYALIERNHFHLDARHPKTLTLPNGRVLETKLLEILGADSVRLAASINQPGGKDFLPLLEVKAKLGQAFIVAGQRYKRGILVLVIRVNR